MEPLNLPLLPTAEEGTYLVLLPGLRRSELKKWDYEVDEENDLLRITCLYGGLDESGNVNGVEYPIKLDENKREQLENLETLHPMNPLEVDLEDYFDEDTAREMRLFFKQLENKYGQPLDEEDT
jgi:hypothetical protein